MPVVPAHSPWKSVTMSCSEVVGKVGEVVTRVRGPAGPGEVRVLVSGCYETLIAYSDSTIDRTEGVLVIGYRGSASVDVVPWPVPGDLPQPDT
jgi:hypothetical protein